MKLDCDDCENVLICRRDEFYDDDADSCPDHIASSMKIKKIKTEEVMLWLSWAVIGFVGFATKEQRMVVLFAWIPWFLALLTLARMEKNSWKEVFT